MGLDSDTILEGLIHFMGPWAIEGASYVQDYIRSKYDDNWDQIQPVIKNAYRHLQDHYKMEFGDWFLWLIP